MRDFQFLFQTTARQDMSDGHLWFSLMSRPTRSRFTRVQRLSCCLVLLFATMITNAMFYKTADSASAPNQLHIGPLSFSQQQLVVSIESSLVAVPISVVVIMLFRKSKSRPKRPKKEKDNKKSDAASLPEDKEQIISAAASPTDMGSFSMMDSRQNVKEDWKQYQIITPELITAPQKSDYSSDSTDAKKKKKAPFMLPWWCVIINWILVGVTVFTCGFFTLLYSMEWGRETSSEWLTSFVLSFFQSVVVIQPIKVDTSSCLIVYMCM